MRWVVGMFEWVSCNLKDSFLFVWQVSLILYFSSIHRLIVYKTTTIVQMNGHIKMSYTSLSMVDKSKKAKFNTGFSLKWF